MTRRSSILLALLGASLASSAFAQVGTESMSGVWRTTKPVHYLVENTVEDHKGAKLEHDKLNIVARSATMEWELTEYPHGLITGINHWIAYDSDGEHAFKSSEALLGAHDGSRVVLSEDHHGVDESARMVFEFERAGEHTIHGIGYSVSGSKMVAMRFVLTRKD